MRRILLLLLAGLVCLTASGCGSFLETEYLSVEEYKDEEPVKTGDAVAVRNYQGLKNAILAMVDAYQAEGVLDFSGYSGDVEEDLPRACSEVKTQNPMCAYAVDYMSYDLSRIVSYYEARVYINFKRTAEQIEQVESLGSVVNMQGRVAEAIAAVRTELTVQATGVALSAEEIQAMAAEAYYNGPLTCLRLPQTRVSIFPDTGVMRIYEVIFDYGADEDEIRAGLAELTEAAHALRDRIAAADEADMAARAAALLSEQCVMDVQAGETAYDALVLGTANSEGFAMAYKAVCDLLGIECLVVSGRLDKEAHSWNIVCVNDLYYHVDVSQPAAGLRSDGEIWGRYWWDIELYPACESTVPVSTEEVEVPDEDMDPPESTEVAGKESVHQGLEIP